MNIIEHLKDKSKAQPFGLRTPEEQAVLRRAGKKNCHVLTEENEENAWNESVPEMAWMNTHTYVIDPDYQPDPQYRDIELVLSGQFWVLKETLPGTEFNYSISSAPTHRQFMEFCSGEITTPIVAVACHWANEGHKVVARFRKETT